MTLAANDPAAIQQRIGLGRIGWAGPLALTTARTVLLLVVQAAVALGFFVRGHPSPWRAQASWLLLLRRLSRREGIRLYLRTRRLPRMIVMHWPMDLLAARMTLAL